MAATTTGTFVPLGALLAPQLVGPLKRPWVRPLSVQVCVCDRFRCPSVPSRPLPGSANLSMLLYHAVLIVPVAEFSLSV